MRKTLQFAVLCAACSIALQGSLQARAQSKPNAGLNFSVPEPAALPYSSSLGSFGAASAIPDPPEPSPEGTERPFTPPDMAEYYGLASRMSVGSGISPFGIGIKSAVILTEYFDARADVGLFLYDTGRFEVSGTNVDANIHLASMSAKLDWYPTKSIWRITPGLMLYNGNRLSANIGITGGTSIGVNGKTYFSANANPVTGATPLGGNVAVGLNTVKPAFVISGGFGRFVPHSRRHWSFPSEVGVAFTGKSTLDVNLSGWVCTDAKQKNCSNVADQTNPIGVAFNDNLQAALTKWRRDLGKVPIFPIFASGVMYSFDLPSSRR